MSTAPLRVALIGLGTVGTGVARILLEQSQRMQARAGRPVELRRVVVKSLVKHRQVDVPSGVLTDDIRQVIEDDQIDVAVQLIGGIDPARDYMRQLLESGKDVVTANKALLCEHGGEIFDCARRNGRTVCFEAAVAGGIPIIAAVGQSLAANRITAIEAILNGTSNFVLTEMLARNATYAEIITDAQALGYAEADPSMDVDGTDAAQKLVILTQLAFGTRVSLEDFPRAGIDTLQLADLKYADELGYTVKLLAVSRLVEDKLEMHVQPTLVRHHRPIAQVSGAFNAVSVVGDAVGRVWFSGPGAGQMPTASAVVADLLDLATGRAQHTFPHLNLWGGSPQHALLPAGEITRRFYLRFNVEDRPHVFADIADILGRHNISLASIIQHEAPELEPSDTAAESVVPVVAMTHRTREGDIRAAEAELNRLDSLRPPWVFMPVAD